MKLPIAVANDRVPDQKKRSCLGVVFLCNDGILNTV